MAQVRDNVNAGSEEISLKELIFKLSRMWKYLLSKWLVIFCAGVLGGILGLTYSILKTPLYKAELSFALEDDTSSGVGLGGALGIASQFGIDLGTSGGGAFSGDNLLELMKSRSMVESALLTPLFISGKKQTLAEFYITFNNLREKWQDEPKLQNVKYLPGIRRSAFTLEQNSVLGSIYSAIKKDNLSVDKLDKKISIITVEVKSENELFSKFFTEILVKTVSNFYIDTKTKKSVRNVNILQKQTDSVRRELNAAISGVALSADVNPNANPALQILRAPSQRRQVDVQANQAILTQLVANLEVSKVSLRKETPLIQVIDRPILPLEKDRPSKLIWPVIGVMTCGFIAISSLLFRKFFKDVISDN